MGAHALGSAAYAAQAAGLTAPDRAEAVDEEVRWQLTHMSTEVRTALRALPPSARTGLALSGPGSSPQANWVPSSATFQAGPALPDHELGGVRIQQYELPDP